MGLKSPIIKESASEVNIGIRVGEKFGGQDVTGGMYRLMMRRGLSNIVTSTAMCSVVASFKK
jgi:hypothetical protein